MKKFLFKHKNLINVLVLVIITILVLYFSLKGDFKAIMHELVNIKFGYLCLAFLLVIIYWLTRSLVLHKVTKKIKTDNKYLSSLQLMLRTQFFNAITPFSTGGQPYQVYFLVKEGLKTSESTSIIMQNFIVYQIALVFLGIVAVLYNFIFHIFTKNPLLQNLVLLGFVMNTLVIVIMFILSFGKKINRVLISFSITILTKLHIVKDKEKKLDNWNDSINKFHESAQILLKNKADFLLNILYNIFALSCLYAIPFVLMFATGQTSSFSLFVAVITSAYVMLIGSFVPIPGASGGLEYGFIAFYGNFLTGPKLTTIMLLWRFVTYYFGMIVGSIALNVKRMK